MTSTAGKGIFAALAISAALLVPTAAATADGSYSTAASSGSAVAKRATPFNVTFTSLTRDGHIVAVKGFKFSGLKANCNGGKMVSIHGRAPRMKVVHRKFGTLISDNGGTVKVRGKFRNHGKNVSGRLRADGKFKDGTGFANGCFGIRDFHASQK